MERSLINKTVLVTGGARNIGYQIATHMLKQKAKIVIILDILEEEGKKACKVLNERFGENKAVFYKCDLIINIDSIFKKVIDNHNYVDVLVNNAGIIDELQLRKLIELNVIGTMELTYKFLAIMRKDEGGKGGTIMNLGSIGSFRTHPVLEVYAASKAAVMVFSKYLGHEINYNRTGVRIVAICPGLTTTDMTSGGTDISHSVDQKAVEEVAQAMEWQEPEAVGDAAVQIFEKADSGTAWVVEGGAPAYQLKLEYNTQ